MYKQSFNKGEKNKMETINVGFCVVCNLTFEGYGNNAEPVAEGLCCDRCNMLEVVPMRLSQLSKGELM